MRFISGMFQERKDDPKTFSTFLSSLLLQRIKPIPNVGYCMDLTK